MRIILCTLLLLAGSQARAENPEATKAAEAVAKKDWSDALKATDAGLKTPGNDRETTVQLYLLRGMALAMSRKEGPARSAFQMALWIQPGAELPGKADAKVMKVWRAARDWARANPGLEFKEEPAATDDKGRVMQIAAQLKVDPLKLGRKVRFHLNADKKGWGEVEEPIQSSYAATGTDAAGVEWWAELLGDRGAVLAFLGSQDKPFLEGTAKEEKKKEPKPEPKPAVAAADPKARPGETSGAEKKWPEDAPTQATTTPKDEPSSVSAAPSGPPMSGARVGGIVLLGAGVAAGVVGIIGGVSSSSARAQLANLEEDASGRVIGMTQRQAADIEAGANTAATLANVMYVTAGVLAGTGVLLIALGGSSSGGSHDTEVTLAPAGPGVVLSGTLP